jgi:NitT/TauT family transport system permease protein
MAQISSARSLIKKPLGLVPLVAFFAIWQAASMEKILPESLMPSFGAVILAFIELVKSGELVSNTLASLGRATGGLAIAILCGVPLGILMARRRLVELAFEPLLLAVYPVPKPAIIPLFMIWLGIGNVSKVTVIALGCMLPIVIATFNGARCVDSMLLWSARARGASERSLLWRVILPATLPQIATGIRTAIAVAIIVLVSSEFMASESGLGYLIFSYGGAGADDAMLAVVLYLAILGFLLDRLFLILMRSVMPWHQFAH